MKSSDISTINRRPYIGAFLAILLLMLCFMLLKNSIGHSSYNVEVIFEEMKSPSFAVPCNQIKTTDDNEGIEILCSNKTMIQTSLDEITISSTLLQEWHMSGYKGPVTLAIWSTKDNSLVRATTYKEGIVYDPTLISCNTDGTVSAETIHNFADENKMSVISQTADGLNYVLEFNRLPRWNVTEETVNLANKIPGVTAYCCTGFEGGAEGCWD